MDAPTLARQIDRLLAAETYSLAGHADDARPFVDAASFRQWDAIRRDARAARTHSAQLIDAIESLGQMPQPAVFPIDVAGAHYVSLDTLLPLMIDEKRRLVALYEEALAAAAGRPDVVATLREIHADHRKGLADLRAIAASPRA